MDSIYRRSNEQGSFTWISQRISGILLLVLVFVHFWIAHYFPGGFVTYEKVAVRLVLPAWKVFDIFLLLTAIFHGLNGIWIILLDYIHKDWFRITLYGFLWVIGLIFSILGGLTIISFPSQI
jgi:succinate dehydrogenase / fumarate reductase membrane anchor subunit